MASAIVGVHATHQILTVGFTRQGDLRSQTAGQNHCGGTMRPAYGVSKTRKANVTGISDDTRVFARLVWDEFTFHQFRNDICVMRMWRIVLQAQI